MRLKYVKEPEIEAWRELMEPLEICAALDRFTSSVVPAVRVDISLRPSPLQPRGSGRDKPVVAFVSLVRPPQTADGWVHYSPGTSILVEAETWKELLAALAPKWAEHWVGYESNRVDQMAFAITKLTFERGEATIDALRALGFSPDEVDRLGARACDKAGLIASKAPLKIAGQDL